MAEVSSSDRFEDTSLVLTEDDCKAIDMLSIASPKPTAVVPPSPLELFRSSGRLSVTDLVSPIWCEVQFDYGLRQRRHRKPELRPKTFVTAQGKEIAVNSQLAVKNNATMERGKDVHTRLEREVHPEVIDIRPRSPEERWALRILNMIAGFSTLISGGICREFPVFGHFRDHLIVGVIDEIRASQTRRLVNPRNTASEQSTLEQFFSTIPRGKKQVEDQSVQLMISDTKTRRTNSIPAHSDTLPARLQLMMYQNLLSGLLSLQCPFDFDKLWQEQGLQVFKEFSDTFTSATYAILISNGVGQSEAMPTSLEQLCGLWQSILRENPVEVASELRVVYRRQSKGSRATPRKVDTGVGLGPRAPGDPGEEYTNISSSSSSNDGASSTQAARESGSTDVIGTKKFHFNPQLLDLHMSSVLDWWEGRRQPEGVKHEDIHRCHTCEYRDGCEWLESRDPSKVESKTQGDPNTEILPVAN